MMKIWGEGLESRYHLRRHVALRRNSRVYEIEIVLGSLNMRFVWYRKGK